MKNIAILIALTCVFNVSSKAQSYSEEVDAVQAIFGIEKREMIKSLIKMTPEEAQTFWPVYEAYEAERKTLGKKRIELLAQTAEAYKDMTPEKAESLAGAAINQAADTEKLLSKYFAKMKKATNAVIGFEFYQAEVYLLNEIRSSIISEFPMYSEIKVHK
jgi:hypothetical protein